MFFFLIWAHRDFKAAELGPGQGDSHPLLLCYGIQELSWHCPNSVTPAAVTTQGSVRKLLSLTFYCYTNCLFLNLKFIPQCSC